MTERTRRLQWTQLAILSIVHFLVDMFGNMLPAILPKLRDHYAMDLPLGTVVLACLMLSANGVQLLTGHLRPDKTRPLFLYVGLVLAASICLLALAPQSTLGVALIMVLALISGSGIAIVHPEGLRGVHALDGISPAMSTAVFMTAGFLGFASGGEIAARLVSIHELPGLVPLALCPVLGVAAVALSRLRLSAGDAEDRPPNAPEMGAERLSFWHVALMGLPAATATTLVLSLVPTYLDEIGFELTFGGRSCFIFGIGGAIGPFLWAAVAQRKGDLPSALAAFALSTPFMLAYVLLSRHRAAVWMLFGVGFCSMSAYILTITLSRYATGLKFGQRMALVVGGTWGLANIILIALSPVAERLGTASVLRLTPLGYLLSALLALRLTLKYPATRRRVRSSVVEVLAHEEPPA